MILVRFSGWEKLELILRIHSFSTYFQNSFILKVSSDWMWNYHYHFQLLFERNSFVDSNMHVHIHIYKHSYVYNIFIYKTEGGIFKFTEKPLFKKGSHCIWSSGRGYYLVPELYCTCWFMCKKNLHFIDIKILKTWPL